MDKLYINAIFFIQYMNKLSEYNIPLESGTVLAISKRGGTRTNNANAHTWLAWKTTHLNINTRCTKRIYAL